MARKRKFEQDLPAADRYIGNLKYKDLKRECVIRGMPFDDAIEADIPVLSAWLRNNFYEPQLHTLLDSYDDYVEDLITAAVEYKGLDPGDIIHPSLRLGYIAERDAEGNVTKRKRVRTIIKKKKKKRERTDDGIFQGTKKALTYMLQQEGKTKAEAIEIVLAQFTEASEKSIGIWFNKSKKLHK